MKTSSLKRKALIVFLISLLGLVSLCVLLALILEYADTGGGFYQDSPDGQHCLSVDGKSGHVSIIISGPVASKHPMDNEQVLLVYRHETDGLYLRGTGHIINWSEDSSKVCARYHDIINGEEAIMEFRYDLTTGCWTLTKGIGKRIGSDKYEIDYQESLQVPPDNE